MSQDDQRQSPTNDQILKELQEINSRLAGFRRRPWKVHMTVQVFVAVVAAHLFTVFLAVIVLPMIGVAILGAGAAAASQNEERAAERYDQLIRESLEGQGP